MAISVALLRLRTRSLSTMGRPSLFSRSHMLPTSNGLMLCWICCGVHWSWGSLKWWSQRGHHICPFYWCPHIFDIPNFNTVSLPDSKNHEKYDSSLKIVSNPSSITNCLRPLISKSSRITLASWREQSSYDHWYQKTVNGPSEELAWQGGATQHIISASPESARIVSKVTPAEWEVLQLGFLCLCPNCVGCGSSLPSGESSNCDGIKKIV